MKFKVTTRVARSFNASNENFYYFKNIIEGDTWETAWKIFISDNPTHEYVNAIELYNTIEEIESHFYKIADGEADGKRIDKILNLFHVGKIHTCSFWNDIKRITRNIKSEKSIERYKYLAEWFYDQIENLGY